MSNKFRVEKHIQQIYSERTGMWSFRVRIKGDSKTFSELEYLDASSAYKAAKKYRDEMLADASIIKIIGTDKKIIDVLYEGWELFPIREQTQKKERCLFNKYIHLDKRITQLTKEDIIITLNKMIEVASDDTIKRVYYVFGKIVKTALIKEYITKDITLGIKIPTSHYIGSPRNEKITDIETLKAVVDICSTKILDPMEKQQYPLMIWFLYYTGCRPCEMFALLKKDIHDGYLTINKEIGSSLTDNHVVRQCKTPLSNRNIPIIEPLKDIIDQACKLSKCDILFPDKFNGYHDSTKVGDKLRKLCRERGINFNMYQIRHLFSTELERANVDPRTHQELMGHKNYTMSINYARSNDELKLAALNNRKIVDSD